MTDEFPHELALSGVWLLRPRRFIDERGSFCETWSARAFAQAHPGIEFVQDNCSISTKPRTARGLHAQAPPFAQAKLVTVLKGRILDVAVDVRQGSPTYGQWAGAELSAENGLQLFIPVGFLHGFVTREPDTIVAYKCSAPYAPAHEISVRFDDPDLAIDWGIAAADAIVSAKDGAAPFLRNLSSPFL